MLMSTAAGTSSQIISLPKGGGALHGIGETFAPDLHTGTGNFTIPIVIPAGRNGFQPQLNLVYSTGAGNGPFGLGWNLSIPGIARKTAKGVPHYDDTRDVFILSGAEDLVPVSRLAPNSTRYRPRTEGLFARIEHHRDPLRNEDFWGVRSKDGLLSYYGTPRPDAAPAGWRDPATITDPDQPEHIFAWQLSCTIDPFGNRIEYVYGRDPAQSDGPHRWDQLYLSEIRYVNYDDPATPNVPQFLVTVRFSYADRPDRFFDFRAGFEVRTVQRCSAIEVFTHAQPNTLAKSYEFVYLDQRRLPAEQLPLNRASLLAQVRVVGRDGDIAEALPPLEFSYTRFEPERRTFFPIAGADLPPASLAHPDYDLVDLFGNGLPDILEMNGTVRYWRNLGGGAFDRPREMRDAPGGLRLADPGVQMIDANGDGRPDLMVTSNGLNGYFPLQFGGQWSRKSFQRYSAAPSFNLRDPEVRLVDLDGDGVTDAIRSGSRLECFFNDPHAGWKETRAVERQALEVFPNINFSDPHVKWADMSGDGLQDIALIHDGHVEYWPNRGHGNWGRRIHMRNSPRFPYGYDPKRILLGDVDGDGLADIVYVDDTKVTLWINQSGNGWSDPITIAGTPVSDMDAVRLTDLLGNGVGGVLWSADAGARSRRSMFFLDFTGGAKPYLLHEMDNHCGALTRVGYAPSTRFYLADQQDPRTRWKTPLPFPVQVVARVEVIDAISGGKLTTEYSYHHGYWDGAEREFRGFGRVDQRDTEVFEDFHASGLHPGRAFESVPAHAFSPPTETRTWFHQGPVGDEFGEWAEPDFALEFWPGDPPAFARPAPMTEWLKAQPRRVKRDALRTLRGSILRSELYALDGGDRQERPYTVTEHLYGLREEAPPDADGADRPHIFFPHALAQRTTQWERGDDPMTQLGFTSDYDAYGQPRAQISIAVPRGRDFRADAAPGEPYLATLTATTYAQRDDARQYLVNRSASATTYEILNDGSPSVFALRDAILAGTAARRIVGHTRSFYDGPAFEGLPIGQIGDYGALTRTESLVLTEEILRDAYAGSNSVGAPLYLAPGGAPPWTDEYPVEFRALLPALAGYAFNSGRPNPSDIRGFYAQTERRRYDIHGSPAGRGRGLLAATRDPFGHETAVAYDRFALLPIMVTDPAGLTTAAEYDYRVLQPREAADPNGNRSTYAFSPLGLLRSTAVMGKAGQNVGDTTAAPGTRLIYDFFAFADRGEPVYVRTSQRLHHVNDIDIPLPERDATIERVEYSDGFGRLLQARAQAEDAIFGDGVFGGAILPPDQSLPAGDAVGHQRLTSNPTNVVVSGWQIYDNKGRVVEKYEPFFSVGWDYAPPTGAELGQKATMFYDPRGHVVRTLNPDGSEQRVIYGVPDDLANPERFRPSPWEAYTYDANDNAGRTHAAESAGYQGHWNTPASIVVDALGRTIAASARNGTNPAADWYITRSTYDIQGNLLTVIDALGRVAFRHIYDLAKQALRIDNIDAGSRRNVLDAAGKVVEQRDSKGALSLHAYDILNRPTRLWARDGANQPLTLRERLVYGDAPDADLAVAQAHAANLLGKLYRHYDEAGLLTCEAYDFKGNLLEKTRRAIGEQAILAAFKSPPPNWKIDAFRIDWQAAGAGALLDPAEYRTSTSYDALNRIKTLRYPQDVSGARKELRPHYNRAGALERVELNGAIYVERIAYSAKGQRALIAYGNGIMTRYAYDPRMFRMLRLRTERYTKTADITYHGTGVPLQDFAYAYDLAGNILAIHDRAPGSGVPNTLAGLDALDRAFDYDPLYRLLSASGREHATPTADVPWLDAVKSQDPTLARAYAERYTYDPLGNIVRMQHQANGGSFTREFALAPGSNRLASVTIGQTPYTYAYDANGNLLREGGARQFEWDHADRMKVFRTQPDGAEPSVYAQYLYDAGGQRVVKLIRTQGGAYEVTVYIDGIFEHHRRVQGGASQENDTLHVMDNQARIALVRVGAPFPGDAGPALQYHLGDHLGSSNLVIDADGQWINREEQTPYGETSFGGFAKKRYRFTGKERDEESGLNYHGARYYAPWVGRWISCDPAGMVDGVNLYPFTKNNPINLTDPNGHQSVLGDIWQGVKNFPKAAIEPVTMAFDVVQSLVFAQHQDTLERLGLPEDNRSIEFASGTAQRLQQNVAEDKGVLQDLRAGLLPAATMGTGGAAGLADNVATVFERGMSPEQAQSFLTQSATTQVVSTGFGVSLSRLTGSGWTGRGPAPNPSADQGMLGNLKSERISVGKVFGEHPGDATFSQGRSATGKLTPVRESVPNGGTHAEPQTIADLPPWGGRTIAVDKAPCSETCRPLIRTQGGLLGSMRVIVGRNPSNPGMSFKSAAVKAAQGKITVQPFEVMRVPFNPPLHSNTPPERPK
jgi:RHS repeat-associated protein